MNPASEIRYLIFQLPLTKVRLELVKVLTDSARSKVRIGMYYTTRLHNVVKDQTQTQIYRWVRSKVK
jgi:hypothetical protein